MSCPTADVFVPSHLCGHKHPHTPTLSFPSPRIRYGRLGSLGAIDDKYDCAITTACGALNFLVVDTVNTAQWCIDYLKKNNVGRVTCICLDKQVFSTFCVFLLCALVYVIVKTTF